MKAPEREYRYRLFSTMRVTFGREVAEYIYEHSDGIIEAEFAGAVDYDFASGPPIQSESFEIAHSDKLFADGFSVVLSLADLAEPVFWYDGFTVVSRGGLKIGRVAGPDVPIYAYLTLLAIVGLEWSTITGVTVPGGVSIPGISNLRSPGWEAAIKSGRLPGPLHEVLEAESPRDFSRAVNRVLKKIAMESSDVRAVPSSEPDPPQQTHEVKATGPVGVSWTASESTEEPDDTESGDMIKEITEYFEELGSELGDDEREALHEIILSELPLGTAEDGLAQLMGSIRGETFETIFNLKSFIVSADHPRSKELLESLSFEELEEKENTYQIKKAVERDDQRDPFKNDLPPKVREQKKTETATTGLHGVDSDTGAPEDALGYVDYAKALAAVICDKTTGMPITLGICAPWGRGKTALLNFLKEEINKINDDIGRSKEPEEHDQRRAVIIDFNAWRYSRAEQVWSGFIAGIMRKLEQGLSRYQKLRMAWKLNKSRDLPIIYNLITFVVSVAVLATIAILFAPDDWLVALGLTSVGAIAFYRKVFKGAWNLATSPAAERISQLSKLPDYASRLDPIHKILKDIGTITELYQKSSTVDRFVVFIDDIDRCEPCKIMETLEAIKHLLDLERFVFVVAMDSRVVRHAIGDHYKFMSDKRQEWQEMGRFYLEKMIQVPFHLPELTPAQRLKLNEKIIARHLKEIVRTPSGSTRIGFGTKRPTIVKTSENGEVLQRREPAKDLEPTPTTPKPTRDAPIRSLITAPEHIVIKSILDLDKFDISPRLLKRFINVYMIARHMLIQEHQRKFGTDDNFLPPESFIKWLALSVRFPSVTKSLVAWLKSNNWNDPFDGRVFGNSGNFCLDKPWTETEVKLTGWTDETFEPFDNLWALDLHAFGVVLREMNIDFDEVRETLHVTNCFNLVLE